MSVKSALATHDKVDAAILPRGYGLLPQAQPLSLAQGRAYNARNHS